MELIFNDLSIHEQFDHVSAFRAAIEHLMKKRNLAREFGLELFCHKETVNRRINPTTTVFEAIRNFPLEEKRVVLGWLIRQGPFWEDIPKHSVDEWFESQWEVVTGSALAEAAFGTYIGIDSSTVSLNHSDWTYSPIQVTWEKELSLKIEVQNYWDLSRFRTALERFESPVDSWEDLEKRSRQRFEMLSFTPDCFNPMSRFPFALSAAKRILSRLDVLNRLAKTVDETGKRTGEGHRLYDENFTGGNSKFSDSSDTEKNEFRRNLTFQHPEKPNKTIMCGWHGKVRNPPYRIHFCWPLQIGGQFHIVHVGWKLTTR